MFKQLAAAIAAAAVLAAIAPTFSDTNSTPYDGKPAALGAVSTPLMTCDETAATNVTVAGIKGYQTHKVAAVPGRYFYFVVDPKFKDGAVPHVLVTLTYFDQGPDSIDLVYDSSDQSQTGPNGPGSWKLLGTIVFTGTKTWRKAQFEAKDALFSQRLNGNDLRVQWSQDIDATLGDCFVKAAP